MLIVCILDIKMKIAFDLCVPLPPNKKPALIMKTIRKILVSNVLQNTCVICLKTLKIIRNKV